MRLFQSPGHTTALAQSMHGLGRARLALGDAESAMRLFRDGVELFRRLGHDRGPGWGLYNLAWVAAQQDRADEAWGLLVEGFGVFRATAYPAARPRVCWQPPG